MTDTTDTLAIIEPIITETYGNGAFPRALATHLAEELPKLTEGTDNRPSREDRIMHICWNWFAGGGTAAHCAKRIESALSTQETLNECGG